MRLCTCEPATLCVVIIAGPSRVETTLPQVIQSVIEQKPDEILVVGEGFDEGEGRGMMHTVYENAYEYINIAPLTHSTIDALVKRDVGFVATTAANICYLADDHRLAPDFVSVFRERYLHADWDMLAPSRFTVRPHKVFPLNVGFDHQYIGGHCGIYRRAILRKLPWSATRHHPNWDVWHTHGLVQAGGRLQYAGDDLAVEDIEPNASPWM